MQRFNYTTFSVPLLCTTDFSWPIRKSLVVTFNKESVEEYLVRSYKIVRDDLPTKKIKTFVHICLCHSMKAITKNVNKYFKDERKFIEYTISLLANSCKLADAFEFLENLVKVLLSKCSDDCADAKYYLDEKAQSDIEKFKELNRTNSTTSTQLESE